jgi:hypothetical protein
MTRFQTRMKKISFNYQAALWLLALILVVFWPAAVYAQSGSSAASQSQSSSQTAQPQSQTQSQSQVARAASAQKTQSSSGNAAKPNTQKDKPKPKHVYTDDDISTVPGTISVVGDSGSNAAGNRESNPGVGEGGPAPAGGSSEAFWRGRARAIKDQITSVDQQISQLQDEIKKSGPTGMDPTTGLTQNVIIIHDRSAQLKQLEDRKQSLEKQMDDLMEEGRKAGADSGWFR